MLHFLFRSAGLVRGEFPDELHQFPGAALRHDVTIPRLAGRRVSPAGRLTDEQQTDYRQNKQNASHGVISLKRLSAFAPRKATKTIEWAEM